MNDICECGHDKNMHDKDGCWAKSCPCSGFKSKETTRINKDLEEVIQKEFDVLLNTQEAPPPPKEKKTENNFYRYGPGFASITREGERAMQEAVDNYNKKVLEKNKKELEEKLRDEFAKVALTWLLKEDMSKEAITKLIADAYECADAMLKIRGKND